MERHDWNDAVAQYLRTACNAEPLTAAGEAEVFRQHSASYDWEGDPENAARRVIESHLRLVVTIAERHAPSAGISVLDLIQEGNIGLFNAVTTFAKNPCGVFSDYASACIEDAISKAVAQSK
jgi:RNA polymerase primary sigma factor